MRNVDAAGLGIGADHPTRIMGVLNVSEESPYKPSVFDDPGEAAAYVDDELIDQGADVVDVGLESANKKFEVLSADQELDRLDTALETIESVSGDAVFSIETRYHEVARAAIEGGFDMVNDVCGFADPEMPRVCEEFDVAVVKMASPPDLDRPGAVRDGNWETDRDPSTAEGYVDAVYDALQQNGFTDKTIVDPAFGGWSEAASLADDRETFRRLGEFRGLGYPVLVSINRKNFLRELAGRSTEAALPVSLAATAMAIERGAAVVRTHDVAETRDAVIVGDTFASDTLCDTSVGVEELHATTPSEASRHLDRLGADGAYADETAVRVFELSGVDRTDAEALTAAAGTYGATVAAGSDDRYVLFGTVAALRRLFAGFEGNDRLERALDRVSESLP